MVRKKAGSQREMLLNECMEILEELENLLERVESRTKSKRGIARTSRAKPDIDTYLSMENILVQIGENVSRVRGVARRIAEGKKIDQGNAYLIFRFAQVLLDLFEPIE